MVHYEHTQPGTMIRTIFGVCAIASAITALALLRAHPPSAIIPLTALSVLVVVWILFHSLTVRVSSDRIALAFGVGLIRKSFAVADVANATTVVNRWYTGWGIRMTRHGWLFNVSGYDAVEIELKNGRKYGIGTDQPAKLRAAIEAVKAS